MLPCRDQLFGWLPGLRQTRYCCVIVGDGHTPRTGALIALRTKWRVISIDPEMNDRKNYGLDRLEVIRGYAEKHGSVYDSDLILIFPHSHASTKAVLDTHMVTDGHKRMVIWLPCCKAMGINNHDISYRDEMIGSPQNQVYIWKDV